MFFADFRGRNKDQQVPSSSASTHKQQPHRRLSHALQLHDRTKAAAAAAG